MKRVLIVDDTETIRLLAEEMLRKLGIETVTATNGLSAIVECQAKMPDAVLLDWNMPIMDGPSFQKALRALPGGKDVKIIFCTVESDLERMQVAMDGGAAEFIMKPFDIEILSLKLQMCGLLPVRDGL